MQPHPAFHWGRANGWAIQFYDEEVPTNQPIFNYDGKIRF